MLSAAFVKTADFDILARGPSKSFVVGRRGTGKSALFLQLLEEFKRQPSSLVLRLVPEEYQISGLAASLRRVLPADASYDSTRALMRVVWRAVVFAHVAKAASARKGLRELDRLESCVRRSWLGTDPLDTATLILEALPRDAGEALPAAAARYTDIQGLEGTLRDWCSSQGIAPIVLVDRLDEGWRAREYEGGLVGGLCAAAIDLHEKATNIRLLLFLRDNIFRLLVSWDRDFSRNMAGDFVRLTWDQSTLLEVVANRLRIAFGVPGDESAVRVWNRFAHRELAGKEGFIEGCLKQTLYRPRDTLELINRALEVATRQGRSAIIPDDLADSAREISVGRLADLFKEYDDVLPGLRSYVQAFSGSPAIRTVAELREMLDGLRDTLPSDAARTFAKLGTSSAVLQALFGVGFIGLEKTGAGFEFRHDGADIPSDELPGNTRIAVHPCYARALDVVVDGFDVLLPVVNDEYDEDRSSQLTNKEAVSSLIDRRSQGLRDRIDKIPPGKEGASAFEEWVRDVIVFLWAKELSNVQLHPNKQAPLRRDIVASNNCRPGLWARLAKSHGATQVVFEVKNYGDLGPNEFAQARAYLGGSSNGNVVFIVYRQQRETLSDNEKSHILDAHGQSHLMVLLPSALLQRWLKKGLSQNHQKYAQKKFSAWVDKHEREFTHPRAGRKS